MKFDELKRIAEENNYEFSKLPGYYKFTRKNRRNYVIYKYVNRKEMWGSFPTICDDKDFNMKKAAIEFAQKEIDEIKEKYNTDLSDFELVEVEE